MPATTDTTTTRDPSADTVVIPAVTVDAGFDPSDPLAIESARVWAVPGMSVVRSSTFVARNGWRGLRRAARLAAGTARVGGKTVRSGSRFVRAHPRVSAALAATAVVGTVVVVNKIRHRHDATVERHLASVA